MVWSRVWVLALGVGRCGHAQGDEVSPPASPPTETRVTATQTEGAAPASTAAPAERRPASDTPRAEPADCPPSFDVSMQGRGCSPPALACAYPQATCECVEEAPCSGVDWGLDGPPPSYAWRCEILDVSLTRADGCPVVVPEAGSSCTKDQACVYSPQCSGGGAKASCERGRWAVEHFMVAPPP